MLSGEGNENGEKTTIGSPAAVDQKHGELFTFMIKAWNFARLQPTLRLTFLDMEPSQIQHWTQVMRRP